MIDLGNLPKHAMLETLVDDLCPLHEQENRPFYRVIVSFFFSKMAATMRATIRSPAIGDLPVNCFAFALAPSGFGKNTAVGAIERGAMKGFKKRFQMETMPLIADQNLYGLAMEKALISGETEEKEVERFNKLYQAAGPYPFTAKKATAAAIEQLRSKLLMANIGAINIQIDEIGMNITDKFVMEGLILFLELYDMGHTDLSVTKNTSDNSRVDEIDGITPANLLAFGTASKLFDGGNAEVAFMQLLDTGYARRCLFAWGERNIDSSLLSVEEAYDRMVDKRQSSSISTLSPHFSDLADTYKHGWEMSVPRDTGLKHTAYKLMCHERMKEIPPHEDIRRTEMEHRHWKALKLAGAFAFMDESLEITDDHLLAAIGVVEESGIALGKVLSPEKSHVKLANYIAEASEPVTHADLYETLPFYKTGQTSRNEMISLATAWGYKNNIIVKKYFEDGIEFFDGETLKETDINDMVFSYSDDQAFHYTTEDEAVGFSDLSNLLSAPGLHWTNHHFLEGHRLDDKVIPGFNMIVLDADGEVSLDFIHETMSAYTFMTSTTKRHTHAENRFRLLFPLSHVLEMDQEEYREFMDNIFLWLPFEVKDTTANQRSKKWLTCENSNIHVNQGKLLSPLPFIPKTSKNAEYKEQIKELASLDNMERWFAQHISNGDRNNQMIKYALALLDSGMTLPEIETRVKQFNASLSNGMDQSEIDATIMRTVARKFTEAA
jgi:hypothetical protein